MASFASIVSDEQHEDVLTQRRLYMNNLFFLQTRERDEQREILFLKNIFQICSISLEIVVLMNFGI